MNWRFWRSDEPIIKFKSFLGDFSVATPVAPASRILPRWMKVQGEKKVSACPGMFDFHRSGYIITAHADIHIKANRAGVVVNMGITPADCPGLKPAYFDYEVVAGMAPIEDSTKKVAMKIPLPWAIFAKPGYSAYVLPALMHADYLDKIYVYPGVIDYDKFHTANFVFSAIKECEVTIPAGTPLLQILPFKRENVRAECGKATETERDSHIFNMPSRLKHYYRKYLSERKKFTMTCPYDHRG